MTLLLLLLPLLFVPFRSFSQQRTHYRSMIALGTSQFVLTATLYQIGRDPWPLLAPHFDLTPLNLTFLLAHMGLQLVAFLSLPRVQRTQRHLLGALLLSVCSVAVITASSTAAFLVSFVASLFVPCVLGAMEGGSTKEVRIFLLLALSCSGLTLLGVTTGTGTDMFTLSLPLLLAASIRLGFVPFHLWIRRLVLGFPIQWSVLYFLSYPSIALFLRARLSSGVSPLQGPFLYLACLTVVYGAWLAVVQKELRKAFYYLLLSFLGAIGVGLAMASSQQALSGVLLFWFSGSLAVAGFGLAIEILESRFGTLFISDTRGLLRQVPALAAVFLLLGLASVGFPGLCAFIGEEVMLSGIYQQSVWAALPILLALSLNGITVLRWFFAIFFGPSEPKAENIDLLRRERFAFFILLAIIVGTGLFPRPLFELGNAASSVAIPSSTSAFNPEP